MTVLVDELPDLDNKAVGRRLRRFMGEYKISRKALATAAGLARSTLSNKLDGNTPFTLDEVSAVAHALNRSWLWVLTGEDDDHRPDPGVPDGCLLLPRMDSNHQPCDCPRSVPITGWIHKNVA